MTVLRVILVALIFQTKNCPNFCEYFRLKVLNDICIPGFLFPIFILMKDFSYITNASPAFIENMYQDFVKDPKNVDPEFRRFFEGFDFAVSNIQPRTNGKGATITEKKERVTVPATELQVDWMKEIQVYRMILGY